ncbi:hypothetical protein V1478_008779 [Vespula squamosa]|uniref:Uncharacterized protein n=1 Tax=Vespula squamosa TaxID=30214 RepID=A0ABD2AV56_VESSQ
MSLFSQKFRLSSSTLIRIELSYRFIPYSALYCTERLREMSLAEVNTEEVWLSKRRDQNSEEKPGGMGLAITQALSVSIACTVSDRAGVTINLNDILFRRVRSLVFNLPARIYFAKVARGMEDGGVSSTTGLTTGDAISRGGPSGPFAFARDFAPSAT